MRRILLYPAHVIFGIGVLTGTLVYVTLVPVIQLLHEVGEESVREMTRLRRPEDPV